MRIFRNGQRLTMLPTWCFRLQMSRRGILRVWPSRSKAAAVETFGHFSTQTRGGLSSELAQAFLPGLEKSQGKRIMTSKLLQSPFLLAGGVCVAAFLLFLNIGRT